MESVEAGETPGMGVGRGAMYLIAGQASLVISGYIVNIGLGYLLGPVEFGRFATIVSLAVLLETVFFIGAPTALGKHIAETRGGERSLIRRLGWLQLVGSGIILLALLGMAQFLSGWLNDPGLAEYIRVIAWGMPASAAFQLYTRILNGLAAFGRQAVVIALFSVLRLLFTFGFVALGTGTTGALWAMVLATVLASWAASMFGRGKGHSNTGDGSWRELFDAGVKFAIFSGAVRFLTTADQLFVKALALDHAQAGFYAVAGLFGKVPHFVALAMSAAIFPLAAKSAALHAGEGVAHSVAQAVRGLAMLLLPLIALTIVLGQPLLTTIFGVAYAPAAQVLWVLVLGATLLGLFRVFAMAVSAAGGLRFALFASLLMVLLDGIICLALIPVAGMVGAAVAIVITASAGCLIMARHITKRFGRLNPLASLGRIVLASAIVGALAYSARGLTGAWALLACACYTLLTSGY